VVNAINHGGGVDSGGADTECGRVLRTGISSDDGAQLHGLHPSGFDPSRAALAIQNLRAFSVFCVGKLPANVSDDLRIVSDIAASAIEARSDETTQIGSVVRQDESAVAKPDAQTLLSKSLCTLQALVSNMEESGEGVEAAARALYEVSAEDCDPWESLSEGWKSNFREHTQAAITAVLGTFDLEALKTLVGDIDDVLGGSR
jgi:hypothetical protein